MLLAAGGGPRRAQKCFGFAQVALRGPIDTVDGPRGLEIGASGTVDTVERIGIAVGGGGSAAGAHDAVGFIVAPSRLDIEAGRADRALSVAGGVNKLAQSGSAGTELSSRCGSQSESAGIFKCCLHPPRLLALVRNMCTRPYGTSRRIGSAADLHTGVIREHSDCGGMQLRRRDGGRRTQQWANMADRLLSPQEPCGGGA